MKTTLTLDDDVADRLERVQRARGVSVQAFVNDVLRKHLEAIEHASDRRDVALPPAVSLGGALLPDVDDVAGILAELEGEERP